MTQNRVKLTQTVLVNGLLGLVLVDFIELCDKNEVILINIFEIILLLKLGLITKYCYF